jgi:hypothetical protein
MALLAAGLLATLGTGLLVWFVAERVWHLVAIAVLAVASEADKDGVIVASVAATLLLAIVVATGAFWIGKLAWRTVRGSADR